jgi:hypothetical protein
MKHRPIPTGADARPRVHIWGHPAPCAWSIGPVGTRFPAETPGQALDAALRKVAPPAVVILEGSDR